MRYSRQILESISNRINFSFSKLAQKQFQSKAYQITWDFETQAHSKFYNSNKNNSNNSNHSNNSNNNLSGSKSREMTRHHTLVTCRVPIASLLVAVDNLISYWRLANWRRFFPPFIKSNLRDSL